MSFKMIMMASALMALAGVFATGCGNACDDAADKLAECAGIPGGAEAEGECSEAAECMAECINNATCEEINATTQNSYHECVAKCTGT